MPFLSCTLVSLEADVWLTSDFVATASKAQAKLRGCDVSLTSRAAMPSTQGASGGACDRARRCFLKGAAGPPSPGVPGTDKVRRLAGVRIQLSSEIVEQTPKPAPNPVRASAAASVIRLVIERSFPCCGPKEPTGSTSHSAFQLQYGIKPPTLGYRLVDQ